MKKTLIVTLCLSIMMFACGCRGNNTGNNMADNAQNMVDDAENMVEDVAQSIFPSELQDEDSEYFKVTDYSVKDNTVTLKGSVMRKSAADGGKIEYEYGKQDTELTFDAAHAEIEYNEEGVSNDKTIKFSSYIKDHSDKIKDKIFKVDIEDGRVKTLKEADYTND